MAASSEKRKTIQLKALKPDVSVVMNCLKEMPTIFKKALIGRFGQVTDLLMIEVQVPAITALAQFYDPQMRSFLFQDFYLTPAIEEFEGFLGFPVKGRAPYTMIGQAPEVEELADALKISISIAKAGWKKREDFFGFRSIVLEKEAIKMLKNKQWDALVNVLALLIYGLVLFPTFEDFVDSAAVSIFWAIWKKEQSPVHPLLADIFYTLHLRHERKGSVLTFCLPILYKWLTSHILKRHAAVPTLNSGEWAQFLASISEKNITWYPNKLEVSEIIMSCGSFCNVPLIGSKGCISYNPILAIRQFEYPMLGKPEDKELEEMILHERGAKDPSLLCQIVRSWQKVHTKGSDLRRRDGVTRMPFRQWVLERVKIVKLPFSIEAPPKLTTPQPVPVSVEEVEEMRVKIAQLGKENKDLQVKLQNVTNEKNHMRYEIERKDKRIEEMGSKINEEKGKRKRTKVCINQADSCLESLKEQLDHAHRKWRENEQWYLLATKQNKEIRETLGAEIKTLDAALRQSRADEDRERQLKEEALNSSWVKPEDWCKMCIDLDELKKFIKYQENQIGAIKEDQAIWSAGRDQLARDVAAYEQSIHIMKDNRDAYRNKLNGLVEFCNWLAKDLIWKHRDAMEAIDDSTAPAIYEFICVCKEMLARFKEELKEREARRNEA
ncbi:unnamed protein product [Lathyrus sativus]|nr:unnamed protein product [Lathyrus sativus]